VAAAAYRTGTKIRDERADKIHDYSNRTKGVIQTVILRPDNSPDWTASTASLWNAVEAGEKRKDAQLSREFILAVPKELSFKEQFELAVAWAQGELVGKGMVAEVSLHNPKGGKNPHVHILATMRTIEGGKFSAKKPREWNDKGLLIHWRESWCAAENAALEKAGQEPSEQIQTQVERVLRPSSRGMLRIVILKCDLLDASKASAGPQLREQTIARLQLPESCRPVADSITNELLGWLHSTALAKWQQNQPVWVERNHFVNQLHAVISLRKRQITRERAEHLIHVTDEKVGKERGNVFVKQLHLITDDDGVVDNAIRDFIRCNIEKSRLSAEGNVTDEDWKSFEAALLTRWDKIRARVTRMSQSKPENDMGFEIFTDTTEAHREKLAGSDTEQVYLTSGTYHRLADMIRVGWHPRFKELMRKLNNES